MKLQPIADSDDHRHDEIECWKKSGRNRSVAGDQTRQTGHTNNKPDGVAKACLVPRITVVIEGHEYGSRPRGAAYVLACVDERSKCVAERISSVAYEL